MTVMEHKKAAQLDLTQHGLTDVTEVLRNPSYEQLFEEETRPDLEGYEHGVMTELGSVAVDTGIFTGRSPKDRFIVKDDLTKEAVWWGGINIPFDADKFDKLYDKVAAYLSGKELYVRNACACADKNYQLNLTVVNEYPWSNMFAYNMFIRPNEEEIKNNSSVSLGLVELSSTTGVMPPTSLVRQMVERIVTILPDELRGKDVVGYWTSTCVVILMPAVPSMMAYSEFHYIQQVLAESFKTDSDDTINNLVPHIGVTTRRNNESSAKLMEQAEKALTEAKQNGKSVVLFSTHKALGS